MTQQYIATGIYILQTMLLIFFARTCSLIQLIPHCA